MYTVEVERVVCLVPLSSTSGLSHVMPSLAQCSVLVLFLVVVLGCAVQRTLGGLFLAMPVRVVSATQLIKVETTFVTALWRCNIDYIKCYEPLSTMAQQTSLHCHVFWTTEAFYCLI